MKPLIVTCYICKSKFNYDEKIICPVCKWHFIGYEDELSEDERTPENLMSIREAKKLYSQGLTIFGDKIENHKGDA